ncbi:MAG: hypothetical protein KME05_20670 [Gloeocapsa sp. UFS-A4-WI-NPMV-4B04]|nr:hypothetical protein [Gloeocapsa sp. UFS-A4-WI-NPMV-4B04]
MALAPEESALTITVGWVTYETQYPIMPSVCAKKLMATPTGSKQEFG